MSIKREIFSKLLVRPQLTERYQEVLSAICVSYPWFVLPKVIYLSICPDGRRKMALMGEMSLNLYANSYYTLQSSSVSTDFTKRYLFLEKTGTPQVIDEKELNDGEVIYESPLAENELFPRGRIVVTKSGLFYSEESEGYQIIKEVIAVNQKIDENGKKISVDKTAEIIEIFLSKKVDKIIPKNTENKEDTVDLSVVETDEIITESMAKIYRMQGLNSEAIVIYRKLSLKYPEKSRYFAEIISSLKLEEENNKN